MKPYISIAFLVALFAPLTLSSQSNLEDNLKAVMLLFDKNLKEADIRISELSKANQALTEAHAALEKELITAASKIEDLEKENKSLRRKVSGSTVRELETASLVTPRNLELEDSLSSKESAPNLDLTPKAFTEVNKQTYAPEHLSDGAVLLVNLNTATERELRMVPGVGPQLAEQIIANRPYESVWDMMKFDGIGRKKIDMIQQYIVIE
ncbi:MAG: helix-hairpin-helix domain-containing protein [Verrucomicrobia bacterium]|nr:helix-hairpin-helix domain-containing protein [Verrucomicrobiota bacterium]MDA1065157.1 helix-hairpin-helix domain-containing protein [Verrucomicrobiota bacterium]